MINGGLKHEGMNSKHKYFNHESADSKMELGRCRTKEGIGLSEESCN